MSILAYVPNVCRVNDLQITTQALLAAALTRVIRAAVPIPAVTAASVLHSAAVGGWICRIIDVCGASLDIWGT